MLRKLSLAVAGTVLTAAVLASSAAAMHSWGNYHWARTSNPFTVLLGDNVSGVWDGHLGQASSDWSQSAVLDTVVVAGGSPSAGKGKKGQCQPTAGRIEVCNGAYGRNGWLGLATIWLTSGSHITQGTTKLNDTYFNDTTKYGPTARQHVMCQEVGHNFGLDHQDESGADLNTCMDYSRALDNPSPNAHDYEQLSLIYVHLDSTSTVGSAVTALGALMPADEKPTKVERRDRISYSTITEHFKGGTKRVTHILWAI
jgi:hypothetical protein